MRALGWHLGLTGQHFRSTNGRMYKSAKSASLGLHLGLQLLKMRSIFTITGCRLLRQKRPVTSDIGALHSSASQIRSMASMNDEPIEEELFNGDRLKYFHPTKPGDILDGRYKTIAKLGFGAGSTVWLAENQKFKKSRKSSAPRFVSVKIAACDANASRELANSKLIANANPSHEGLSFIRTPGDEFQLNGTNGTHLCLVYDPMRETLSRLQHRLQHDRLPPPMFKFFIYCLLHALDYLHNECRLIHTDIKDDNIMMSFENEDVLMDFVKYQKGHPQPIHVRPEDGRVTYLSQSDFGPLRGAGLFPALADFDLALPGREEGYLSVIQSHRYRAPEVLLGCPWSYSVDIWNIGLLMWNLLEDTTLFNRPAGEDGEYDANVHLAQMVCLLGDPPQELIERERFFRGLQLSETITNFRGKECKTMNEFWGGPFFDDQNQVIRKDLLGQTKNLADTVTELAGDEKAAFLDLASSMLQWMPEKRKTARELWQHPFIEEENKLRAQSMQD